MNKFILTGATLAVAALLAGCGSSDTVTVTETVEVATAPRPAPRTTTTESRSLPGLGASTRVAGSYQSDAKLTITPLAVDYSAPKPNSPAALAVRVRRGNRLVRVKLRLRNQSDARAEQMSVTYQLVDGDGMRFDADQQYVYEPHINCCGTGFVTDAMSPGDRAEGFVTFQVPNDRRPERLRVLGSSIEGRDPYEWQIG
jgi:hypothetical protein